MTVLTDRGSGTVLAAAALDEPVTTKSVFAGERLAALVTAERLDLEVNTLVALQIVIAVLAHVSHFSLRQICKMREIRTKLWTHSSHLNGRSTSGKRLANA